MSQTYNAPSPATGCVTGTPATKPHAAASAGSDTYIYDCNGNMKSRTEGGVTYTQNFDAENRLSSVTLSTGGAATSFKYDGDGNLVAKLVGNVTTYYIGSVHEVEVTNTTVTKKTTYYPTGGVMRVDIVGGSNTVYYVVKDQLGSASVTLDSTGNIAAEMRYYPFGETRVTSGTMPTDRLYTGQQQVANLGLYNYGARFYDPRLGRFISADTIVPKFANPQSLNRFSYGYNNPLKYTDPSGHCPTPDPSWGAGICFALFIAPPEVTVEAGGVQVATVKGDGRGYSSHSDPSESRLWVYVPIEGNVAYYSVNPSGQWHEAPVYRGGPGIPGHWEFTEPSGANQVVITQGSDGQIVIQFDVVISGLPLEWTASHINGTVTFRPNDNGGYSADVDRDGFPWAEAYYHDGQGGVQTIFRDPAIGSNPHNLSAYETFNIRTPLNLLPQWWYRYVMQQSPQASQFTTCILGQPC